MDENQYPTTTSAFSNSLRTLKLDDSKLPNCAETSGNTTSDQSGSRTVYLTERDALGICGVPENYREFAITPILDREGHKKLHALSTLGVDAPDVVYVHGGVGTGKTHMATYLWWIIHRSKLGVYRAEKRYNLFEPQARWLSGYQFIHEMKEYSRETFNVLQTLKEFTRPQLATLLVDDVFADGRASDADIANVTQLVEARRTRIAHHTILTGNLDLIEMREKSERLADRLAGAALYIGGVSHRLGG